MMTDTGSGEAQFVDITTDPTCVTARIVTSALAQREAPIITDEIMAAVRSHPGGLKHLVVDMTSVTFMSSVGIGMLVSLRNAIKSAKGDIVVAGVGDELMSLLQMTKLDKLFRIENDRQKLQKLVGN